KCDHQHIHYFPTRRSSDLKWEKEILPEFIKTDQEADISKKMPRKPQFWETLFISGGRKDKISKGDIAGLFFKQGNLNKDQLGEIDRKSTRLNSSHVKISYA